MQVPDHESLGLILYESTRNTGVARSSSDLKRLVPSIETVLNLGQESDRVVGQSSNLLAPKNKNVLGYSWWWWWWCCRRDYELHSVIHIAAERRRPP